MVDSKAMVSMSVKPFGSVWHYRSLTSASWNKMAIDPAEINFGSSFELVGMIRRSFFE